MITEGQDDLQMGMFDDLPLDTEESMVFDGTGKHGDGTENGASRAKTQTNIRDYIKHININ